MLRRSLKSYGACLAFILISVCLLTPPQTSAAGSESPPTDNDQEVARVLSVRKVTRDESQFFTRYPRTRYFILYFSVRIQDTSYCADYETPVLDEISDLTSAKGKDVEVILKHKNLMVVTPAGRKLKARLVGDKEC